MNKNTVIIGVIAVIVVVGGLMLTRQNPAVEPKPSVEEKNNEVMEKKATASMEKTDGAMMTKETAITIENFAFSPATITVKKGTKVTWTNQDSVKHTVTSDTGSEISGPLIGKGETFSYVFDTVGSFSYHCQPHPNMKANVIVE